MKDKGLKASPLKLNAGLGQLEQWNEDAIKARADKLACMALDVWKAPSLTAEVLATYRPQAPPKAAYTIDDHPHLLGSPMRELFEASARRSLHSTPA
jgi:hypothetical protein